MNLFTKCTYVLLVLFICANANSAEYWVSKSGSDSNACSNSAPCLTIQKALSLATQPDDKVTVRKGLYIEDSSTSPFTKPCSWLDGLPVSLCLNYSGTKDHPIVLTAAAGDEDLVILDNQSKRVGIHTLSHDYLTINGFRIINSNVIGIASWGQTNNVIPNQDSLSIGVTVSNNHILDTSGAYGTNISGIGMWGSKDWKVFNNIVERVWTIDSTRDANCIQAYGLINAQVHHNYLTGCGSGIYWKDHFMIDANNTPFLESEISYNIINPITYGIQNGIRGTATVQAGDIYVHHNIIYGYKGIGYFGNLAGAAGMSGSARIEYNLFDGFNRPSTQAISVDSHSWVRVKGNIILRSSVSVESKLFQQDRLPTIKEINYNVFDSSFQVKTDRYSSTERTITDFSKLSTLTQARVSLTTNSQPLANSQSPMEAIVNIGSRYKPTTLLLSKKTIPTDAGTLVYPGPYNDDATPEPGPQTENPRAPK